jgi:hypothetical protein
MFMPPRMFNQAIKVEQQLENIGVILHRAIHKGHYMVGHKRLDQRVAANQTNKGNCTTRLH